MKRTLVLRHESLAPLSDGELAGVAGGRPRYPSEDCPDNTYYCLTGPQWCNVHYDTTLCP
jgi:hypothetical protein